MKSRAGAIRPRKRPVQARSRQTVEWVLEAAARVFLAEGFGATTNRIAKSAGVSVGSLYEYFPNKQALLSALAERHVAEAERGIGAALAAHGATPVLLASIQAAIVASQRFPSQALELASADVMPGLRKRVQALRVQMLAALCERARRAGLPNPELHARTAFALIGELSSRALYELPPSEQPAMLAHALGLAQQHLSG